MTEWWNGLDLMMKVLYCIAIPSSLLLLLQTIISLIGFGDGGAGVEISDTSGLDLDLDLDMDGIPDAGFDTLDIPAHGDGSSLGDFSTLRLFTIQGLVAFFAVFSWVSIISVSSGTYPALGIMIGLILGFAVMVAIAKILRASRRLTENGVIDIKNCLGQTGTVYIPIPSNANGHGKIVMDVQGRFCEFDAINCSDTVLASNTPVRVTDIRGLTLVVEKDI